MTTSLPLQAPDPAQGQPLRLTAAQSLMLQAPAGSTLVSSSGRLLLTAAPRWLGEQVCRVRTPLEPGQAHAVEHDGWITLTAGPQGAEVCLLPGRKSARFAWLAALRQSIAGLARAGQPRTEAV